jgi:Phage derived protein Gp49-like (DUF891)
LPTAHFATAAFYGDLLAERGPLLGEPYTRQLDGKLRELRFHLERRAVRVPYWTATGRRIVLLTVFAKSRMREEREIDRARRALGHGADITGPGTHRACARRGPDSSRGAANRRCMTQ